MKPETAELVRYHEALAEARLLLVNDHVRTAVNRVYYGCFYAVSPSCWLKGIHPQNGVRVLFDQHWIVPGRLPKSMGRFYRRLFDSRQKGDYVDPGTVDRTEVGAWLDEAENFVEQVARLVEGFSR